MAILWGWAASCGSVARLAEPALSPGHSTARRSALDASADLSIRTSEPPHFTVRGRARAVWGARSILFNLVRKEVKVKYKSSALGVAWSLLNPVLYLAVFSLVFSIVLSRGVPDFPVYLLSGLLAWSVFTNSVGSAARSVVENANLVSKVSFPREILPLASVGATLVDVLLQGMVLVVFMLITGRFVAGRNLLLLPLSMFALLTLTSGIGLWVAALNVRYRDTQHLLGLTLLAGFWLTPVVYPSALAYEQFAGTKLFGWLPTLHLYLANPMAAIVEGYHRALYGVVAPDGTAVLMPVSLGWLAILVGAVAAGALVILFLAWRTFFLRSGDFAEEL